MLIIINILLCLGRGQPISSSNDDFLSATDFLSGGEILSGKETLSEKCEGTCKNNRGYIEYNSNTDKERKYKSWTLESEEATSFLLHLSNIEVKKYF